jgi:hypothetical protein
MSKRSAKGTFTAAKPASPSSTQPGPSSLGGTHGDDAAVENIPVSPLGASVGKKRVRSETNVQPWIPASLAGFDLSGAHCKPADMPLQPVMPHKEKITDISEITDRLSGLRIKHEPDGAYYIHEERDSFAKDVHPTPYHPSVTLLLQTYEMITVSTGVAGMGDSQARRPTLPRRRSSS